MNPLVRFVVAQGMLCLLAAGPAFGQLEPEAAQQVSVGIGNSVPDSISNNAVVAPNGDVVVFQSDATNIVRGDLNGERDIFQRAPSGAITRLSVSDSGEEANDASEQPSISQIEPDGKYAVAFSSSATNLVNVQAPEVRYKQIYLRIPSTGKTYLVSRGLDTPYGDADSVDPSVVSLDGGAKYMIAFSTKARNLSTGGIIGGPNNNYQIAVAFVMPTGLVDKIQILHGPNGVEPNGNMLSPRFSGSGDRMVFVTDSSNLNFSNPQAYRQVVMAIKQSGFRLLSKTASGEAGNQSSEKPSINFDGTKVAFRTMANNLFESSASSPSYVLHTSGEAELTLLNTDSKGVRRNSNIMPWVHLDPSGRFVSFISANSSLVTTDTNGTDDVFVKDLETGSVVIGVKNSNGEQADGSSNESSLGRLGFNSTKLNLSFYSSARNLGPLTSQFDGQVFRSKLDFPPPALAPDTKIETPPDVKTGSGRLFITLQNFSGVSSTSTHAFWNGEGEVGILANRISYDVRLTRSSTGKVQKTTSSRNRVAFRNLSPGKYSVRYRVSAKTSRGKTVTSRFSPSQSVTVKSS